MTDSFKFGQFISEKRTQLSMNKQELAKEIGISTAYLSQIESGIRSNPKETIINKLIISLHLTLEETQMLYDLYAAENNTISIDISRYIMKHGIVSKAIRTAEHNGAKESDWIEFIEKLSK